MTPEEAEPAKAGPTINWAPSPPPAHANMAAVYSGADGFLIGFSALVPRFGEAGDSPSILDARVVAHVHLNPGVYFQFAASIVESWNKYRDNHAPDTPRLELQVVTGS